jgi:hypothetical protein
MQEQPGDRKGLDISPGPAGQDRRVFPRHDRSTFLSGFEPIVKMPFGTIILNGPKHGPPNKRPLDR